LRGSKPPLLIKWCGGHTSFSFYMLVFVFIPPLFCGIFVFIPTLCCGVFSLFLHCFVVFLFSFLPYVAMFFFILTLFCGVFLYWWTTRTFYSYSVNTISCYITKIITHHPIISPVLINILSLSGTLYVVWLFTSVSIEKYNMMLIQMLFIVRNWNIPEKKRNKSSKTL
jgi:hypothetical protein